ncbi:MAG TPA: SNF2-related protein, partial [Planctomycetota bacterium]|nr:SNF2-related protein [Planctomycetota bacterium]
MVRFEVDDTFIRVEVDDDTPQDLAEFARDGISSYVDGKHVYLLPLEAGPRLRRFMADPRSIPPSIAGPGPVRRARIPAGVRLYSHQPAGVRFLMRRRSAFLADDMGLGKTLQAVLAAEIVRTGPVLVVCPAGLIGNWLAEIGKWAPQSKACIQTTQSIDLECDYSIVSYDSAKAVGRLRDVLLGASWSVLIVDEAHRAKSTKSGRHNFLMEVRADRVWQLSGMPMLNRPADILGLLRIGHHPLGDDAKDFARRFVKEDISSRRVSMALGLELAGWVMRRYKSDVLDLPVKEKLVVTVRTSSYNVTS